MAVPMNEAEWKLVAAKRPVDAVRAYRERTGVSLSDAYFVIKAARPSEEEPSYLGTLADALGRPDVMAQLSRPAVSFGGYVAVPNNHADGDVFAWWSDGSIAQLDLRVPGNYIPLGRPDYATLFPASVAAPEIAQAWDARVEAARDAMPFRGDLPDQPRPDDADDIEYPRTRRGRDD
jgi:hypothetical protein